MANPEHVKLLKSGVGSWNAWREEDKWKTQPDLREADLSRAKLSRADLSYADLSSAELYETDLYGANLSRAKLIGAILNEANLSHADLHVAYLSGAILNGANLSHANLSVAYLSRAKLIGADLSHADVREANLIGADLSGAALRKARLDNAQFDTAASIDTVWLKTDLTTCLGLDTIRHAGPSILGHHTLQQSRNLPEAFLRGCGLSDIEIEAYKLMQPGLTNMEINDIVYRMFDIRATQTIQINPLFISYSHTDTAFVNKIGAMLTKKGVRYWRDIHHATAGKLEKVVDRAMRLNPTVLIVLSNHAVNSDWVEHEVRKARKLEQEMGRDCLCPIALDGTWKTCKWPERLKEQLMEYNILDFSEWQNSTKLERQFSRLLQGLDLFYE